MVRRGETTLALKTAISMLIKDPVKFFRRLLIIIIEDVTLCLDYPYLTWLMMCQNHYQLYKSDIEYILGIV